MNERLLQGDLFWVYCGFLMNCKGDRDTYSHMAGSSVELVLSLFCLDTSWKAPHCPWNKNQKQLVWVVSVEVYQTFLFLCHFERTLWSCTEDRSGALLRVRFTPSRHAYQEKRWVIITCLSIHFQSAVMWRVIHETLLIPHQSASYLHYICQ